MSRVRVAIIAGARTSLGKAFAGLGPPALAKDSVRGLLERHDTDSQGIEAITEMARRDADYGLISSYAAGAMAGAFVLELS